jgi:hypothetical protein
MISTINNNDGKVFNTYYLESTTGCTVLKNVPYISYGVMSLTAVKEGY